MATAEPEVVDLTTDPASEESVFAQLAWQERRREARQRAAARRTRAQQDVQPECIVLGDTDDEEMDAPR